MSRVRNARRAGTAWVAAALLGVAGCGTGGDDPTAEPVDVASPEATTSPEDAGAQEEDAAATEPTTSEGGRPAGHDTATKEDGDGSAEGELLTDPGLPESFVPIPPDGPHYAIEVCGVQLDPEEPRDAAQRQWGDQETWQWLESEVHVFEDGTPGIVDETRTALQGCDGYGVTDDGEEVPLGEGDLTVTVTLHEDPAPGWVMWTEETREEGMVRHIALTTVEGGWHWVSFVDRFGTSEGNPLAEILPAS